VYSLDHYTTALTEALAFAKEVHLVRLDIPIPREDPHSYQMSTMHQPRKLLRRPWYTIRRNRRDPNLRQPRDRAEMSFRQEVHQGRASDETGHGDPVHNGP